MKSIYFTSLVFAIVVIFQQPLLAVEPLIFGVHPYLKITELKERFNPLMAKLSQAIGQPVVLKIARDYEEHISQVGTGKIALAYMGPASYITMTKTFGNKMEIIGRNRFKQGSNLKGSIIISQKSPIKSLEELKNRSFAFGDVHSTMSHIIPYWLLNQKGLSYDDLKSYDFLHSHTNVALGILIGDYDAGAVKKEVYLHYKERGLKELVKLPEMPSHVYLASKSLPPSTRQKVKDTLLNLQQNKSGKTLLKGISKDLKGVEPASDEDFAELRQILANLKYREK